MRIIVMSPTIPFFWVFHLQRIQYPHVSTSISYTFYPQRDTGDMHLFLHLSIYTLAGIFLRSLTVCSYRTSLKANKNAAVSTLWETLGPIPEHVSDKSSYKRTSELTLVKTNIALLSNNSLHAIDHVLLTTITASNMHTALDRDVWVGDGCSKQLAQCT